MSEVIAWISAGVPSFVAAYIVRNRLTRAVYIHVPDQESDSLRFLRDCDKALGLETEIIESDKYESVNDVIRTHRFVNGPCGARCTTELKIKVRKEWERKNLIGNEIYVWGYYSEERHRAERLAKTMNHVPHIFPLIELGISRAECHQIVANLGIQRPRMYDLGYANNNCVGCVKAGMWYWNKIRKDFPQVFEERAKLEREIGHSCIKGVFLDELEPTRGRKPRL